MEDREPGGDPGDSRRASLKQLPLIRHGLYRARSDPGDYDRTRPGQGYAGSLVVEGRPLKAGRTAGRGANCTSCNSICLVLDTST